MPVVSLGELRLGEETVDEGLNLGQHQVLRGLHDKRGGLYSY